MTEYTLNFRVYSVVNLEPKMKNWVYVQQRTAIKNIIATMSCSYAYLCDIYHHVHLLIKQEIRSRENKALEF